MVAVYIGQDEAALPAPPTPAADAHASHGESLDPASINDTRERLLLESSHRLEAVLCRFRYALGGLAVAMSVLLRPSWLLFAMSLLIAPLAINAYVYRSLRRLPTKMGMRRLARTVLTADTVMAFGTFLLFLGDAHAMPAAFMPLLVFELSARFDWHGTVLAMTISAVTLGVRALFQLRLLPDGSLRSSLLMVWIVLTVLMLVLGRELRHQDTMRLTALAERERIAGSFREVIGGVLARSGVPPQAASWTDVLDAVRRICDERSSECTTLSTNIADLLVPAAREFGLTRREREIIRLLATGHSYDRIARMLSVSSSTVRNHCHNVRGKLGLSSREEVVAFAFAQGLVQLPPTAVPDAADPDPVG